MTWKGTSAWEIGARAWEKVLCAWEKVLCAWEIVPRTRVEQSQPHPLASRVIPHYNASGKHYIMITLRV